MTEQHSNFQNYFLACYGGAITDCSVVKKHQHCTLCNKVFDTPFHCKRHFTQSHASRAVLFKGIPCFPCKREHSNVVHNERSHFHCPVCAKTILQVVRFEKHLKMHDSQLAHSPAGEDGDNVHGKERTTVEDEGENENENEDEYEVDDEVVDGAEDED